MNRRAKAEKAALRLNEEIGKFKAAEKAYEEAKRQCEEAIFAYMDEQNTNELKCELSEAQNGFALTVKKVEQTRVSFDADKLQKALGSYAVFVIDSKCEIADYRGLVKYLASKGVNAQKFKSFLRVTKQVNRQALDSLIDDGSIDAADLKGCYTLNVSKPFLKVNMGKLNE